MDEHTRSRRPGGSLRVLHVLEAIEGGTARHLVDVVTHARGIRHVVAIPAQRVGGLTDRTARSALEAAGAEVHLVGMRRNPGHPANLASLAPLLGLARRADLTHAHSSVGGALGRLVATAAGRPCIYSPNGIATGRAAMAVERLLGRLTDRLVAVSASEAQLARRSRLVATDQISVIPNGIDLRASAATIGLRERFGLARDTPLVGSISRFVAQKAPERLARLAGWLRTSGRADVHVVVIGAGPLQGEVDRTVEAFDVADRFHQIPEMTGAARVLGQLDLYVLLSRFEGAPYSILEAMRAGTAVVATDVVGTRDVVVNGVTGLLVAEDDDAIGAGVAGLLADPSARASYVAAAADRLVIDFDVRVMGRSYAALYDEVIGQAGGTLVQG